MSKEKLIKSLDEMLDLLAKHKLVTEEHVLIVEEVEKLISSEQEAWDMLDEMKKSENFSEAFGAFMRDLMGSGEVGEA